MGLVSGETLEFELNGSGIGSIESGELRRASPPKTEMPVLVMKNPGCQL